MLIKQKNRFPLKTVYYLSFLIFIVIPILIVLIISLLILNQQFKKQSVANIKQAQETIITELSSDINVMSMRLSHLIYTNNNEILGYAAGTDTSNSKIRYEFTQKLVATGNFVLEPVKDIISVGFYMKSGRETYIKEPIKRLPSQVKEMSFYQQALQNPNSVRIGSYDTKAMNEFYSGGKKDSFILVFALAPNITSDRSGKIEMVTFYQSTKAAERIKKYNSGYLSRSNRLGITLVKDNHKNILFSTIDDFTAFDNPDYTCVTSPITFHNATWYIESYIKTSELTADFWGSAWWVLCIAILVLLLAGYYSSYFLKSIVNPIEEISTGLKKVEEGNLEVHVSPSGQFEIRTMIHQFNAMVRRLKSLIGEYEAKVKNVIKNPYDYFAEMIKGELTPKEVSQQSTDFFTDPYALIGISLECENLKAHDSINYLTLANCFERNPRFASRCILYMEKPDLFILFYRITEKDYLSNVYKMSEELQKIVSKDFAADMAVCIGRKTNGYATFYDCLSEVRFKICLRHLMGSHSIIDLNQYSVSQYDLLELSLGYKRLAKALYTADEKVISVEKESLFEQLNTLSVAEGSSYVYASILAIANLFSSNNVSFSEIFGQPYNYIEKIQRITDMRSLKLWIANYFAWISDYSASKLNLSEADIIIKSKRFLADHYEDADLSLIQVAEYIGLNEKYFTNRFTKETGETFSSYLTGFRMQKAKELLKSTNFKVYEISDMVGYHNVEHFNRMFKKINNITPIQYRKT